jgi:hypothetical protein
MQGPVIAPAPSRRAESRLLARKTDEAMVPPPGFEETVATPGMNNKPIPYISQCKDIDGI